MVVVVVVMLLGQVGIDVCEGEGETQTEAGVLTILVRLPFRR